MWNPAFDKDTVPTRQTIKSNETAAMATEPKPHGVDKKSITVFPSLCFVNSILYGACIV
jgi:hypothetical protein